MKQVIIIRLQRPESGCVVLVLACVGVCVVRPFPGGRHSHAARRLGRDRGASGAGDAVNGYYEKKTVSSQCA